MKKEGSATFVGEERARQGKGLDPLVDPAQYEVIRQANSLLVPDGDVFNLEFGVAMPVETDCDTTGSMGGNVDIAFGVLPKVQALLVQGKNAVLRRYHTQIATGVIQDRVDRFPYQRSQFEPDNEVERQMGLLVPERGGADETEDYQLGLFAAGYLTQASITKYGLRGYYFIVGDEIGRDELDLKVLQKKVFGSMVLEKAFGVKSPQSLPSTKEIAKKTLHDWHVFFLQVGRKPHATDWWSQLLGEERVVRLPRTSDLAEVQACIIGLTEGVLDLRNVSKFLTDNKVATSQATQIVESVRSIPVGLQKTFPNFEKIPMAGARFKSRDDIWPIGVTGTTSAKPAAGSDKKADKKKKPNWKA